MTRSSRSPAAPTAPAIPAPGQDRPSRAAFAPDGLPDDDDAAAAYDRPSKSQLKREMHALQKLGIELVELPKDPLARMPMPDKLADAVGAARRITNHEGRRRQLQYIGKVMRGLHDDEVAALRQALDTYHGVNSAQTAQLHATERWRERLLADDAVLTEFIRLHPGADPQEGRTLIRNARRERDQNKPPRHFRLLFQWIKDAAEHQGGEAGDAEATGTGHVAPAGATRPAWDEPDARWPDAAADTYKGETP